MKRMTAVVALAAIFAVMACGAYAAKKEEPAVKTQGQQSAQIVPKKVSVDTNFDGKPDRTEYYDAEGRITRAEADANGDGIAEETVIYEGGKPVRSVRDTNGDGKPDVWVDF